MLQKILTKRLINPFTIRSISLWYVLIDTNYSAFFSLIKKNRFIFNTIKKKNFR